MRMTGHYRGQLTTLSLVAMMTVVAGEVASSDTGVYGDTDPGYYASAGYVTSGHSGSGLYSPYQSEAVQTSDTDRTLDIVANLPPVMMVATFFSAFFGAVFAPVLGFVFSTVHDIMSQFDVQMPRIVRKDDKYLHYQDRQSRMDGSDSDSSLWEDAVDSIVESLEK